MEIFTVMKPSIPLERDHATVTPVCVTSALRTPVQGIAARSTWAGAAVVRTDVTTVVRERAAVFTGKGHLGFAGYAPGLPSWSPPI